MGSFYQIIDGTILRSGDAKELAERRGALPRRWAATSALVGMGLGFGAALMYLLDPDAGAGRRRQVAARLSRAGLEGARRDEASEPLPQGASAPRTGLGVADSTLLAQLRDEMARAVGNPDAITVSARNGVVTLRGHVREDELKPLLRRVAGVRGVEIIENQLSTTA
jgi:hypothetical protein